MLRALVASAGAGRTCTLGMAGSHCSPTGAAGEQAGNERRVDNGKLSTTGRVFSPAAETTSAQTPPRPSLCAVSSAEHSL